jgi:hypothetical protein
MLRYLERLVCRHTWMWSERRRLEVCYSCGKSRTALQSGPATVESRGLEALSQPPPIAGKEDDPFKLQHRFEPVGEAPGQSDVGPRTDWDFGTLRGHYLGAPIIVSRNREICPEPVADD